MKDENWIGDIRIIFEIIKLLLDLAPTNKELVALNFEELRHRLRDRDREGIEKMRNSLKRRKTMFDPMDTVEKV